MRSPLRMIFLKSFLRCKRHPLGKPWDVILGPDEFVAAFGSSGAEDFAAAGGGHAGAESDVFSSFGFIRSVCRQHFVSYTGGGKPSRPVYSCY